MKHSPNGPKRAPRGVGRRAVNMRLPPQTFAELEGLAEAEGLSLSAMAGIIYLEGVEARKSTSEKDEVEA